MCKWGLVIAGLKDMARPAEMLSVEQAVAIGATGFIYSRFSMVIIPKNYTLLSVNVFVAITQSIQLFRALRYKYENRIVSATNVEAEEASAPAADKQLRHSK